MFDMTQREDNENNNLLSYAVTNNFSVLFGSKAETKSRIYNPFPIKFYYSFLILAQYLS